MRTLWTLPDGPSWSSVRPGRPLRELSELPRGDQARGEDARHQTGALLVLGQLAEPEALEERPQMGLHRIDGSVVPRSLGVNPLLTISALAERCCALLAEDRQWTIQTDCRATS